MIESLAAETRDYFRISRENRDEIELLCRENDDTARFVILGKSEEGREIYGTILGRGDLKASLVGGAHGDEPVGPETLGTFIIRGIREKKRLKELFEKWTFFIVPHLNPDGENRNAPWIKRWPSIKDYLKLVQREPPGRDIEFGYPDLRKENQVVTRFWEDQLPFHLHISFHGMGFSEGALLLIERHWIDRTKDLREAFIKSAAANGLSLHDHNRKGEKGFYYIGPGFSTTPEGKMMRFYFESAGDKKTASLFRDSSMEWIRQPGGNPLCLVTELPLFVIEGEAVHEPGVPGLYNQFKGAQGDILALLSRGEGVESIPGGLSIRPLPVSTAIRMNLNVLQTAINTVQEASKSGKHQIR